MTGKIEIIAHEGHLETRTFVERVSRTDKAAVVCAYPCEIFGYFSCAVHIFSSKMNFSSF